MFLVIDIKARTIVGAFQQPTFANDYLREHKVRAESWRVMTVCEAIAFFSTKEA